MEQLDVTGIFSIKTPRKELEGEGSIPESFRNKILFYVREEYQIKLSQTALGMNDTLMTAINTETTKTTLSLSLRQHFGNYIH